MKSEAIVQQGKTTNSQNHRSLIMGFLILALLLSSMVGEVSISVLSLYSKMERIQAWDGHQVDLDALNSTAYQLSLQPDWSRRATIATYQIYSCDRVDASYKLFLLMRLLFDVPEEYEGSDARGFDIFFGEERARSISGSHNFLWPLGYDESGQLILKYNVWGYMCLGLCSCYYKGLEEYDYFAARFPLRGMSE
jgi:hypothetical protein